MKLQSLIMIMVASLILASCGGRTVPPTDLSETVGLLESDEQQAFFNNLSSLCGQTFVGEEAYRSHHGDSWAEFDKVMHVSVCEDTQVQIPFHVGENRSRTWMFSVEDGKLRFQHQHLHEDGTHEEGSMYGGFATETGTAFKQYFPADEYSANVIEDGGGNVWIVSMDENMTYFSYRLDRDGEQRLEYVFDLTQPLTD